MRWLRGSTWWRQIICPNISSWLLHGILNANRILTESEFFWFSNSFPLFYWYYALVFISGLYPFKELVNIGSSDDWGLVFMVYLVMSIGYTMKTCTMLGEKLQKIQFISLFHSVLFFVFLFVISHQLRIMCSLERKKILSFCFRFTSDCGLVVDLKLCSFHTLVSANLHLPCANMKYFPNTGVCSKNTVS